MHRLTVLSLRAVLICGLLGSLLVQLVMVPLAHRDLAGADPEVLMLRTPLLTVVVLGILTVQVAMVAVWRLLTMVRRGTVFSSAAFRWVDVVIGAVTTAALLLLGLGVLLAPGEAVAPGVVLLVGGLGGLVAGVALVVVVMRALLVQAVARDAEARELETELEGVV